jgi:hypothetical protein
VERQLGNPEKGDQAVDRIEERSRRPGDEAVEEVALDRLGDDEEVDRPQGDGRHESEHQANQDIHGAPLFKKPSDNSLVKGK